MNAILLTKDIRVAFRAHAGDYGVFEQFLSSQMLLGFVTGAAQRPPTTIQVRNGDQTTETPNPEYLKWLQKDQHVMAWLYGSLSETALKTVYGLRSSHEVWFSLSKKYNRVSATRKLDLQRKMQSTLKGDRTMSEYLTEMKTICDQLDSIGAPLSEQEKIYGVLNGLGREYQSVCGVIENSMDLFPGPCLEDVFFKLTGFEDKLQKYEALPEVSPHQAFYTNRGGYSNRGRGQNRGRYRGRNSYSTQGRGFFQQFGSNSGRGSYSGGDNYSDSRPTCQICGKYGHAASKCYKRFDQHYQSEDLPQALAAMRMSDYTEQAGREWIPDSAATYHITNSPHNMQQVQNYDGSDAVIVGNGDFLPITHIGSIPLPALSEALFTANFLSNLLPTSVHQSMTSPYQLLNNKAPIYTALRVFGCACYPYLRPYAQNKLDPRSLLCVFVGYNEKYKGYRCFHPPTGRVYISRHVLFDESRFPYQDLYKSFIPPANSPLLSAWQLGNTAQQNQPAPSPTDRSVTQEEAVVIRTPHHIAPTMQHQHEFEPASPIAASSSVTPTLSPSSSTTTSPTNSESPIFTEEDFPLLSSPQNATNNAHHMMTRAKSGIVKPNPKYILIANKGFPAEPRTIAAALKHPGWTGAMEEEIDTCHETKTWSLEPLPDNANVLGCKWIFKTKIKADGTLDKLRARLVAKGYEQEEGVDFLETFSPVVRTATVRMILHVATVEKWDIKQLDVKNAFLHGDLHETVYMKQPPGFEDKEHPNYVCRLHKAIYGLKQAPRAWFDKFSSYLLNYGFVYSPRDPSLFVYLKNNSIMLLLLYVDDMVLTGNDKTLISDLLKSLGTEFRMKDMGPMAYFLGIQATFTPEGLFLNQEKYAKHLLENAGMLDCAPMPTPLPIQLNRVPYQDKEFEDPTYFRSLAGKLQYLTLTRPDLQFAVNYICQKMHKPSVSDFALLKRTLRYLKGTIDMGLTLSTNTDSVLRAYSDSDHAGCTSTRRSTGGFCTFLGLNLISWSAKRQDSVARSSTEAEYRALSDTAAELSWISSLLKDIGIQQDRPAELYCDNLSAVHLTANPVLHKRSKHFETHYHFAREKVADGSLVIKHVPAWLQLADIFTKSLPQAAFYSLRFKLGVGRCPTSSLRGDVKDSSQAHHESRPMKPKAESSDSTVMLTTKSRASSATSSTVLSPSSIQLTNRYSSLKNMDQ
ncbi:Reverse transcriptase RNA-dependent DNA polymerase [Arabidopsis thaliana x Arabidopsis arenosa]|uniref:Reverse transcriptase RNA-dependent DNA polymerase n=1 Tax=Arabidopsis thaliana x Arabidopsis arenosa TaxID=1240361 RepID=A0A8T2A484_9BRAS|nr:Reverse transcriptase RNA-dependent DNA polymerase [Arabidopsis thaliana x Arabidopsis arenosa]